jgi:hypothetical protein
MELAVRSCVDYSSGLEKYYSIGLHECHGVE